MKVRLSPNGKRKFVAIFALSFPRLFNIILFWGEKSIKSRINFFSEQLLFSVTDSWIVRKINEQELKSGCN